MKEYGSCYQCSGFSLKDAVQSLLEKANKRQASKTSADIDDDGTFDDDSVFDDDAAFESDAEFETEDSHNNKNVTYDGSGAEHGGQAMTDKKWTRTQ